jgi:8-oxo-dGTP pyrophosphatase MutT (NUDIX family)
MKNKKLKREFSAGCVVFKKTKDQGPKSKVYFLIGKHSGYHKWVLPKGLIEEGERGWQTAIRETEEEVGVKAKLVNEKPIHKVQYFYYADLKKNNHSTRRVAKYQEQGGEKTKIFKTVSFYLAEFVSGDPQKHGWEMEEAGWFEADEALKKMAFPGEKEALKKASKMIK